jgi:hypothetical protein
MKTKTLVRTALCLSALGFFVYIILVFGSSSLLQVCISNQTATKTQTSQNQTPPSVLTWSDNVAIYGRCFGHVLYEYRDATTAVATVFIAIFTATLWWSTRGVLRATNATIQLAREEFDLARLEFLSSHRPEMRLKLIWFDKGDIWNGDPISVRLDMVNAGRGDAWISRVNFMARVLQNGERLPQRPPYNEEVPDYPPPSWRNDYVVDPNIPLRSGVTSTHSVSDGTILTAMQVEDVRRGKAYLCLFGTIEYLDAALRLRQTAFCRQLFFDYPPRPGDRGRFQSARDPDYEYQD